MCRSFSSAAHTRWLANRSVIAGPGRRREAPPNPERRGSAGLALIAGSAGCPFDLATCPLTHPYEPVGSRRGDELLGHHEPHMTTGYGLLHSPTQIQAGLIKFHEELWNVVEG